MRDIFAAELIDLDVQGESKSDVILALAARAVAAGRSTSVDGLVADVLAREAIAPTGFEGVAIPHARSEHCGSASVVFGRHRAGVDFGDETGVANLIFLIIAPADGSDAHLTILAALARRVIDADFRTSLLTATTPAVALAVLQEASPEVVSQ